MPRLFDITTPTNTIVLDRARRGEASFTVTNISGQPRRARLLLVPEDSHTNAWLSLQGEPVRAFVVSETQQITVNIQLPPPAPSGSYGFRLDLAREDLPDEDLTQGPRLTVQVPESGPKPAFPLWVIPVVLGAIALVGGVIAFLVLRPPPAEPEAPPPSEGPERAELVLQLDDELSTSYLEGPCEGGIVLKEWFAYRVGVSSQEDLPLPCESIVLLTFDTASLRGVEIALARLNLDQFELVGDPFGRYGVLMVEEVSYGPIPAVPWIRIALDELPINELYRLSVPPEDLDVTEALKSAIARGSSRFQLWLRFAEVSFPNQQEELFSVPTYYLHWDIGEIRLSVATLE